MKILLINNISYRKGGSESVFFNTAELLRYGNNEVRLFSISEKSITTSIEEITLVPSATGARRVLSYFYNRLSEKKMDELLLSWKPDIAHIHLIWGGLSPSIIQVLHKHSIPVVHTAHDYRMVCPAYTFRNGKGEICEKCKKCFFPCIIGKCAKGSFLQSIVMAAEMRFRNTLFNPASELDGIIYVSEFSKNLHETHNHRLTKVKNIILYNFTRKIDNHESEDFFLYSGRLSSEKGCETMINAFRKMPNLRLFIAGGGPLEMKMREISKDSGNIQFYGHLRKKELFELIQRCRFVVIPSEWYENNPMSVIEAYAASKPVIGAKIGGIPEIVSEGETGFLFKSGDETDLCRALKKSAEISEIEYGRMRESAFRMFSTNFSNETYADKLQSFYMSIINNKKKWTDQ